MRIISGLYLMIILLSCTSVKPMVAQSDETQKSVKPTTAIANAQPDAFAWPEGKKMAISLTFDDARLSNVDVGTPFFDKHGVKVTFFVLPSGIEMRHEQWKEAVSAGHEIGNHTIAHPCSGNFDWSRKKALEEYSLEKMLFELDMANKQIHDLLGVSPKVFAYPCGQDYVGRGVNTQSYVPLIAQKFLIGRGWMGEAPNDPGYVDMARLEGMEMDGKDFDQILPLIEKCKDNGLWLVLAGHEIGEEGFQTTEIQMLEKLIAYAKDPENGIWLAPAGAIGEYVKMQNETRNPRMRE